MNRIIQSFIHIEEIITAALIPIMCIITFIATFGRYSGLLTLPWGDELTRYMLVYVVFIGSAAAAREGAHFSADMIVSLLPKKIKKYVYAIQMIVHTIFCLFVCYYGFYIVKAQIAMEQISASLQLPMWTIYIAVPIGCLLMMFHYIERCINEMKSLNNTLPEENSIKGGSV